jgi:hypothetical protein
VSRTLEGSNDPASGFVVDQVGVHVAVEAERTRLSGHDVARIGGLLNAIPPIIAFSAEFLAPLLIPSRLKD